MLMKVFTDVNWSNLSRFMELPHPQSQSSLQSLHIPAPPSPSAWMSARNSSSIIPRSPTRLPQSQIPVRRRVSSMQPQALAPPPRLGRSLQVGLHTSRTLSREPVPRGRRADGVASTTLTPLAPVRVQDATPIHTTTQSNGGYFLSTFFQLNNPDSLCQSA